MQQLLFWTEVMEMTAPFMLGCLSMYLSVHALEAHSVCKFAYKQYYLKHTIATVYR